MKFWIDKTSDYKYCQVKEFNTLQDLLDFMEECGEDIILSINMNYGRNNSLNSEYKYRIEIYDDYRE